jgi:phage/plasmid-associated DNA primase
VPQASKKALSEWQEDSDSVKIFTKEIEFGEVCLPEESKVRGIFDGEKDPFKASAVYRAYSDWAKNSGYKPVALRKFYAEVMRHGIRFTDHTMHGKLVVIEKVNTLRAEL